jgi:hypothetical protein
MRWHYLLALMLVGCTSAWQRHQSQLTAADAGGHYAQAVVEARWLVDNAFQDAPGAERSAAAEARRYLRLGQVAIKAGNVSVAIEALRQALTVDPHQAAAIRAEIDHLPLPADQRDRFRQEFAWNSAALAPADNPFEDAGGSPQCWSYRVREVRLRHHRTVQTVDGSQRQATYDARPWRFDAGSHRWQAEGGWVTDAGTEIEPVSGPEQPRYRAIVAADHEFVSDDGVPPCHRARWRGPYDAGGTIFVAAQLP